MVKKIAVLKRVSSAQLIVKFPKIGLNKALVISKL